jgi:hypothetical protein
MTSLRLLSSLVLVVALAACDSAGPEPVPGPEPGPASASISIELGTITANGNCDSSSNPGDYQFRIVVSDLGNNPLETMDLPNGATYGEYSVPTLVSLFAGNAITVGRTVALQQPRAEGSGFAISLSASEWDSATTRDSEMNDLTRTRSHPFSAGQFVNVLGTQTVRVRGSSDCDVELDYTVTVQ